MSPHTHSRAGFTLVELIVVIVLTGILAGGMVMYFKPAIENYLAVQRRSTLSNLADGAVRTINTEIRTAVPNSIRLIGGDQCVEFVPTSDGGRYRMGPDTVNDALPGATPSAFIDTSTAVTQFDVLSQFTSRPVVGDHVVIGNQTAGDVYAGSNRALISAVGDAPAGLGTLRITLAAAQQFPIGYDGGRFVIVPKAKEAVIYRCVDVGIDSATGTGKGTLVRYSRYGFNPAGICPPAGMVTSTLATKVSSCSFTYNPNEGATQQSGYLQVQLGLSQNSETATLSFGSHVDNMP